MGLRIHVDDALSLGIAWAPSHEGCPLMLFLLGLVTQIGCFEGDPHRIMVWSLPTMERVMHALRDPKGTPDEENRLAFEARWYSYRWYPVRRRSLSDAPRRVMVPECFGVGLSFDAYRWQDRLTWRATGYLGWWRAWIGRHLTRRRPRVTPATLRARDPMFLADDEE